MRPEEPGALSGELMGEYTALSVDELCRLCAVERTYIVDLVEEGVLRVTQVEASEWRFSGEALRRARIAARLRQDLEINVPGVALALELLEELEQLRRELQGVR